VNVNDTTQGVVTINTIALQSTTIGVSANPYPWNSVYFKGVSLPIRAQAKSGYEFVSWSLSNAQGVVLDTLNSESEITLTGDTTLTANFSQIPCPYDLDGSREIDTGDVALVLLDSGTCQGCATDFDESGEVDSADVSLVLLNSGPCQ